MADVGSRGTGNGLLYGVIGALCVVVAGGGYYIYKSSEALVSAQETAAQEAAKPAPTPPAPPAQAAPRPTPPPAPTGPSASQLTQTRDMIADARRLAATGNFGEAETALQNADRIIPGFAETSMARREIADMRTARGQNGPIGPVITRVRQAIARHDYGAADRALDEAERIDARDPAVVQTRNELLEAAARPGRPPGRN